MKEFEVLIHNCIKIKSDKIIYTDPFNLNKNYNDADIIFITHSHYDHFSPQDIEKVRKEDTIIVVTEDLAKEVEKLGFSDDQILTVIPNEKHEILGITFTTLPAYNVNKKFHPRQNNWCGYIIEIDNEKYYIAGDTDITDENKQIKCDVAFVPVGGTYTMTAEEAAKLINCIEPRIAVPVHYGEVVGSKKDAEIFKSLIKNTIECRILL